MNELARRLLLQNMVREKFGREKVIKAKVVPRYPASCEREYKRILIWSVRQLFESVREFLPELQARESGLDIGQFRTDEAGQNGGANDLSALLGSTDEVFDRILKRMQERLTMEDLRKALARIATMTREHEIREWRRLVHQTLGINIFEDYYRGEFFKESIDRWISDNVSLIQSIPQDSLDEMRTIVKEGFTQGKTLRTLTKEIQQCYGVSKSKAKFLATDQLSTLSAQLTRQQQEDAGVSEYTWSDSNDERVRDCHRELNGTVHKWSDPPEMWYRTKKGIVYTGRRCNPGEDYRCRCCAIPHFNIEALDLPFTAEPEHDAGAVTGMAV